MAHPQVKGAGARNRQPLISSAALFPEAANTHYHAVPRAGNHEPPWWLAGTARQPFPRPAAYGFIRSPYGWEPIRFSIRPGPDDCWLFAWHPFPDTGLDVRLDLATLLDRGALADKLARRGRGLSAQVIRDCTDWRGWMLALLEREGA